MGKHPDPAAVLPKTLVSAILKSYTHNSPFTGHLVVTRTLDRIRKRFFCPQMQKSIENYFVNVTHVLKEKHQ